LPKFNVAIFASGEGSNAQNLWRVASKAGHPVRGLICDRQDAGVIKLAEQENIPHIVINKKDYLKKQSDFEAAILNQLIEWDVNWIFLAGFMTILSSHFLKMYFNSMTQKFQVINIHPSLLPQYPGTKSYQQAYADKVNTHGVTVHYVDEGVDTGPIIEQQIFTRDIAWSFEEFVAFGKSIEHKLYEKVFLNFLNEHLE